MVQHTFCQRQRCFCAWTVGGIQFLFVFTAPQMITYIYIYLRLYNTWSSRSSAFFADSFVSSRTCPWCKAQFCSGASHWSLNVDSTSQNQTLKVFVWLESTITSESFPSQGVRLAIEAWQVNFVQDSRPLVMDNHSRINLRYVKAYDTWDMMLSIGHRWSFFFPRIFIPTSWEFIPIPKTHSELERRPYQLKDDSWPASLCQALLWPGKVWPDFVTFLRQRFQLWVEIMHCAGALKEPHVARWATVGFRNGRTAEWWRSVW